MIIEKHWYEPLKQIVSKGSSSDRPGSLAGLAKARQQHLGQFFTPSDIAAVMWKLANIAIARFDREFPEECRHISLFDNSIGSGRLFQFADPSRHELHGVDVDHECINALSLHAQEAGFQCNFYTLSMDAVKVRRMDIAIINPPFSVHLESPYLMPYRCTCYGRFGPNTAASSHNYAVSQAIDAAQVTIALVPHSFAVEVIDDPLSALDLDHVERLHAVIHLPTGVFSEENTDVRVSILVFGNKTSHSPIVVQLKTLEQPLPPLDNLKFTRTPGQGTLRAYALEDSKPYITLPVTGDNRVLIHHDGRRIKLRYHCGLVQAKVENCILRGRIYSSAEAGIRLPKGIKFMGQGKFDLEVYLSQADPDKALSYFYALINQSGGNPIAAPGFVQYWKRRVRRHRKAVEPFRHTAYIETGSVGNGHQFVGKAIKSFAVDKSSWSSPVIKQGDHLELVRSDSK